MSKGIFGSIKDKMSRSDTQKSIKNPFRSSSGPPPSPPPMDAPPAYSADAPPNHTTRERSASLTPHDNGSYRRGRSPSPAPSMVSITNDDDKYAFLRTFDTVFVIDDSGSMDGSSWQEVRSVLNSITPICTDRDRDGIDLYFLNHRTGMRGGEGKADGGYYKINDPRVVNNIFGTVKPRGATETGARLHNILKPYTTKLSKASDMDDVKPVNIIVITDGSPTDDPEGVIVQHARKLDQLEAPLHQVGIQFFQVGHSRAAKEALRELDDDLAAQGIRDMVDASTWDTNNGVLTGDGVLKVVLGAVVRKLDRRRASGERRLHA